MKRIENHQPHTETRGKLLVPVFNPQLEINVGNRLRELRHAKGMTLRTLAEKSGLTMNCISLIEHGRTSPTISTLQAIAMALNTSIAAFFETTVIRQPVIFTRKDERINLLLHYDGEMAALGENASTDGIWPFIISIAPKASSPIWFNPGGPTFAYDLLGQVNIKVSGKEYTLTSGDSLLCPAKVSLAWTNPLDEPAQMLLVAAGNSQNM